MSDVDSDVDSDDDSTGAVDDGHSTNVRLSDLLAPFWANIESQLKEAMKTERSRTGMRLRQSHAKDNN